MAVTKKRALLGGAGLILVLGSVWWFSPMPLPGLHSPQAAADHIANTDDLRQRDAARSYGELVAKSSGWEEVAERGEALPMYVQDAYFGAVAYSDFLSAFSQDDALSEMKAHVPAMHHPAFCNGLVRVYAAAHADSPDEVLGYMDSLGGPCGGVDLTDGLRIGVQEAVGENLGEAFAVIETYPPDLHDSMVEELGWRYGDEKGMAVLAWESAAYVIPDHNLCSMACGVTLGAMHRALANGEEWVEPFEAFHASLPIRCQEAAIEGLADALIFVIGPHDATVDEVAVTITDTVIQEQIKEQIAVRLMLHEARQRTSAGGDRISSLPASQRWHAAHVLGFLAGMEQDLEGVAVLLETLSPKLESAFVDGLSHGLHPDLENPEGWIEMVSTAIPSTYRSAFMDALLRAYTEAHAQTPAEVLAFAERTGPLMPGYDPVDGIRIGVQQALGGEMSRALQVVLTYPEAMQSALIEELGWRHGTDAGLTLGAWTEMASSLSDMQACTFGAGMVRGAVLQTLPQGVDWSTSHDLFAKALPESCGPALDRGLAEALLIALGTEAAELQAAVQLAPNPERVQASVKAAQVRFSGPTTP